jgi:hypothetical protein
MFIYAVNIHNNEGIRVEKVYYLLGNLTFYKLQ